MLTFFQDKFFTKIFLVGAILASYEVQADQSKSVFGLSLGMAYEEGIKVLKERDMFSHVALGNKVVGKNYKKCEHHFSSASIPKACNTIDFTPTKLSKEAPKSEWKISQIEYTQGFVPPINEKLLLETLEERYGKLSLNFEGGKEEIRRLYFGMDINSSYSVKGITSADDLIGKMMLENCKHEASLVEVSTRNKFNDTFNVQITLHDLTRKCKQKIAIEAYKKKLEKKEIEKQLKLD